MKKIACFVLGALLMLVAVPITFADSMEDIDVTGFWYSEDDGSGIELQLDGVAIITSEDGDKVAEGTFVSEGPNLTITAGDTIIRGVVTGDSLNVNDGEKFLIRDGIEVGYWYNYDDESSFELGEGLVWSYNKDGDLLAEGTYTVDGNKVTIQLDGRTLDAVVDGDQLTIDGVVYNLL